MINKRVWSITQLLAYIKSKLTTDAYLTNIRVEGEIGNFKPNFSGHWYFSLKDEGALIDCAMFKNANYKLNFMPKDGDKVTAIGNVSVYEKSGRMQLIITSMELSGAGNFYIQFERMKNKLAPLGYFDLARKKKLPLYPNKIAVVTGANTAALRDIQITTRNRWPLAELLLCPATVQGIDAPNSITNALIKADSLQADVCILARGGGSVDDLWCFNDEQVAKTIFELKTPIVTGIGHEIDTTIADLVADERCATPTAAATRVTPDRQKVLESIDNNLYTLKSTIYHQLNRKQQTLDYYYAKLLSKDVLVEKQKRRLQVCQSVLDGEIHKKLAFAERRYHSNFNLFKDSVMVFNNNTSKKLNDLQNDLTSTANRIKIEGYKKYYDYYFNLQAVSNMISERITTGKILVDNLNRQNEINVLNRFKMAEKQFSNDVQLLDSVSPLKVLARGYSITQQNNSSIKSIDELDLNEMINVRFSDGTLVAQPIKKEKNHE